MSRHKKGPMSLMIDAGYVLMQDAVVDQQLDQTFRNRYDPIACIICGVTFSCHVGTVSESFIFITHVHFCFSTFLQQTGSC